MLAKLIADNILLTIHGYMIYHISMNINIMKALVKTAPGKGNMEIRELPVPEINENEVLIKVYAAGICGSDLHLQDGDANVAIQTPVIPGHEFCGEIVETGGNVKNWKTGQKVTAEPSASVCGECFYCRIGSYNLCAKRKILGFWANGAFAEYIKVPSERLHRLPDNISFKEGALIEPFACCVHGVVERADLKLNDVAVISGPGDYRYYDGNAGKSLGRKNNCSRNFER